MSDEGDGKAMAVADLERMVLQIEAEHYTNITNTVDLVQHMDLVISACRVIVARRMETSISHHVFSPPFSPPFVNDAGIDAINRSLQAIVEKLSRQEGNQP